jgi:uncharacterized protein (DUF4213/DUF364 family)
VNHPVDDEEIPMELPAELEFERLRNDEKYLRAVPGYMKRIRDLYEAIHDRFGEEGLALIRQVSEGYGRRIAANLKKKRELKGVAEVGRYLLKVFDMVSDDWQVAEFSEDRLVITVDRCPYPFTRDVVCRAHTCMEQALVTSLDPDLEYRIGRSIPQGDACCEHILCRRTSLESQPVAGEGRSVIGDLIRSVPEGVVLDVRVGAFWTAVVVASEKTRRCGLASNLHDRGHDHGPEAVVQNAGALCGRGSLEIVELARSTSLIERSIGLATINALVAPRPEDCVDLNAEEVIARHGKDRNVVIVGSFPFVPRLRQRVGELAVLDMRQGSGGLPAEAAGEVVPHADVLAVTATSLLNGTFDGLMALRKPGAHVVMLGPSTPLSPVLFDHGVQLLSGSVVENIDPVLMAVSQGANFRQVHPRGVRLVTMSE